MEELLIALAIAAVAAIAVLPIVSLILIAGLRGMVRDLARGQRDLLLEIERLRRDTGSAPAGVGSAPEFAEAPAAESPAVPAVEPASPLAPVIPAEPVRMPPPLPPAVAPVAAAVPEPPAEARAGQSPPPAPEWTPVPEVPIEPGRFETLAARAWAWILMGGEDRLKGHTREFAIASWWLLVSGIGVVVLCTGYFLKLAIEHGWIGPAGRVGMSALFGVALIVSGLRMLGKKYHLIGQGFLGGGLLILYFAAYSATSMYKLIPIEAGFALMALVTAGAGVLAVRTDSMLVAFIGLAGGFITPLMLRTPTPNLPGLYAYILLLDVGVMGVARRKDWPVLNYAAFILTYALFWGSMAAYDRSRFPMAMSFLSLFFVVHAWICCARTVLAGRPSTTADIVHLALNAAAFAASGYALIRDAHGRPFPAFLSLGLAAFYVAHVLLFLRRGKADKRLLMTLIALAGVFTAWTLPLVLEKESLSIAVAILAFMFLWLGGRLHSGFLQSLGHLLYMIVLWRFFVFDLRGGYGRLPAPSAGDMSMYWKDMAGRMWTFGMIIGSAVLAFLLERRQARLEAAEPERAVSDQYTARAVSPGIGAGIFFWCSIAVAFVVLHKELALMFSYWRPFHAPALTCLWAAMGCMFLWNYATGRWNERAMFGLLMIFFFASAFKVLFVDMDVWRLSGGWIYTAEYGWRHLTARCLDFAMVTGVGAAAFVLAGLRRGSPATAALFGYASLAMIFLYATFETKTFLSLKLPAFLGGGVSALWALFAIAFVGSGIWKSVRGLRYLGLALFAVVLGKVFLADLAHMPLVHRVVAFMVVGAALLLGSFAYLYAGRKFTGQTPSNGETGEA